MLFVCIVVFCCKFVLSSAQPTIKLNDWMTSNRNEIYTSFEKRLQTSLDFILVELKRQTFENIQLKDEIAELRNQTMEQSYYIQQWTENVTALITNVNNDNWTSIQNDILYKLVTNITKLAKNIEIKNKCNCKDTFDVGSEVFDISESFGGISYIDRIETPNIPTTEISTSVTTEANLDPTEYPTDCTALYENQTIQTGSYFIKPNTTDVPFRVRCEIEDERAWTVIQRRTNGKTDFYRNWKEYKEGFGNLEEEFWLGNEKIFQITNQAKYTLRIDMWDWVQTDERPEGNHYYTESQYFHIDNETNFYTLFVPDDFYAYSGYGGSGLRVHSGPFITYDVQPSEIRGNCAEKFHCGWWFSTCVRNANLNGKYYDGGYANVAKRQRAIDDIYWSNIAQSLRKVVMKISRRAD